MNSVLIRNTICVLAVSFFTGHAQAGVMTCSTGSGNSAATLSLGDSTAAACYTGNDSNQIDGSFTLFGKTGWKLADKNDDNTSGDGTIQFVNGPANGSQSGDWSIDTLAGLMDVVITLKAGNGFGAFLLDVNDLTPLSGIWRSSKDLSHASIYYNGTPVKVPEPGTSLLMLLGLFGLALARKKTR